MSWTVKVNFGAGLVDLQDDWDVESILKTQTLHKSLRPTVNYCTFNVTDKTLANSFLTTTADIPITVQKDAADWFVGIIRHNYDAEIGADFKELKVEAVDKSILLQKKVDTSIAYEGFKVSNPSSKAASVLHQFFYEAGIIDAELDLSLVDKVIDYFVIEQSDDQRYDKVLADLLYEFGYVYDVGDDGIFTLHDLYPAVVSGAAIEDADIEHVLKIRRQERKYEGARIVWYPHVTLTDALVFSDTTDGDEEHKCVIPIGAGEFYPEDADTKDTYARYEMTDYAIIIVTGETLDWIGTGVTEHTFTPGNRRALAVFTSAGGGTLNQFDIRGTAVVRDLLKEHRSVRRAVVDTDKILEVETFFITADVDANRLCNGLADYYVSSAFSYTFPTIEDLSPGDILDLTEAVMSISTDLRVVAVQEDEWGNRQVVAEAISAYSINGVTSEDGLISTNEPGAGEVKVTTLAIAPSDENLVGYWTLNKTPDDFSGRGHHGTLIPGAGGYEQFIASNGFHFDNAASYVAIADHTDFDFGTGDFAIALWSDSDDTPSSPEYLFGKRQAAGEGFWIQRTPDGVITGFLGDNAGGWKTVASSGDVGNEPVHIVFTRIGGTLFLYISSILHATEPDGSYTVNNSTAPINIGRNVQGNNYYYDGILNQVRLYSAGLTQANVNYLHFNPAGTQVVPKEANMPSNEGLRGYWPLADTLRDFSGKHRDGVFNADGGNYEDSPVGRAWHFNPVTNDSIQLPADLGGALTTFTICGRLYLDTLSPPDAANRCYDLRASSASNIAFYFDSTGDNKLHIQLVDSSSVYDVETDLALEAGRWYFVVATYDGKTIRLYVENIQQIDTQALSGKSWTPIQNAIGSRGDVSTISSWDGLLAHWRLYDIVLDAAEREYLMVNPRGTEDAGPIAKDPGTEELVGYWSCDETADPLLVIKDSSGQENDLDDITGTLAAVDGHVFNAVGSVAANDDAERSHDISTPLSDALATGDFSISIQGFLAAELDDAPLAAFGMDAADYTKFIRIEHGDDEAANPGLRVGLYSGSDQAVTVPGSDAALEYDAFYHVVFTVDRTDDTLKLYIGGVFVGSYYNASIHTFTNCQIIGFLTGAVVGDRADEVRVYSKILDVEEVIHLNRNPGGTPFGMATKHNVGASEINGSHMIHGGYTSMILNSEIWDPDDGELFPLNFSCVSDHGRSTEEKRVHFEPALRRTEDGTEYNNPRARVWDGLHDDPYLNVIGVYEASENVVDSPENLDTGGWVEDTAVAVLVDKYLDGFRFTEVKNLGAASGFVRQSIDTTGFAVTTPCIRVLIQMGSGTGDKAIVQFWDSGVGATRMLFSVDWANPGEGGVTFTTGEKLEEHWISSTIVEVAVRCATITPANTHLIRCYGSDDAVANEYNYYTKVQIEDKIVSTPYMYDDRRDQVLRFRKPLTNAGTIDFWARPRDRVNTTGRNQYYVVFSNKDFSRYFIIYWGVLGGNGRWFVAANVSGSNVIMQDPTTYSVEADYLKLWHVHVTWDFTANEGSLWVDGVLRDTTWAVGSPGAMDSEIVNFNLGCKEVVSTGALSLHANGEIMDLSIKNTVVLNTAHYDTGKPWKPKYLSGNYDNTVGISRKAIEISRVDIAMLDIYNRQLDLGSRGIYAEDAQGKPIHDIPQGVILRDMSYSGHTIMQVDAELLDSLAVNSLGDTSTEFSNISATQNLDVTSILTRMPNAKALYVNARLYFSIAMAKTQAHSTATLFFCPLFEYDVVPVSVTWQRQIGFHFHGGMPTTHDFDRRIEGNVTIPIVWNGNTPYISWVYIYHLSLLKIPAGDLLTNCTLVTLGVFV